MQVTDSLSLTPLAGSTDRARLRLEGSAQNVIVPGVRLERQFLCDPGYLVMVSDDCPFEEALHILLLDRQLHLLDGLRLGHAYTGAMLSDVDQIDRSELRFSFFGHDRWQLRVLARGRRLWSRAPAPAPAWRITPFWQPRWLQLHRLDRPAN